MKRLLQCFGPRRRARLKRLKPLAPHHCLSKVTPYLIQHLLSLAQYRADNHQRLLR